MELEDEESSSSLSSSEWEDVDNCPEAGEADDEQSDWPGIGLSSWPYQGFYLLTKRQSDILYPELKLWF